MAAHGTVPVPEYAPSIVGEFPRIHRHRQVESSIASRQVTDILPVNLNGNSKLKDKYLEFRVPAVKGSLVDLSKLILEIKLSVTQVDGVSKLEEATNVEFANGIVNTLFKSIQIFFGDQMIETNPYFNYWAYIKMITSLSQNKLKSLGMVGNLFKPSKKKNVIATFNDTYFNELNEDEKQRMKNLKENGLHVTFPLMADVTSSDQYLCDDVPIRIRLELADEAWFVNTNADGKTIKPQIDYAKLWITHLQPYPSAMQALSANLESGKTTNTLYNKTLCKTLVLGRGQTSLVCDQPWGNVIPERLYMVMCEMSAFSGEYKSNGLHFGDFGLQEIVVSVNGNTMYKETMNFPHECSHLYYNVLESLGLENDTLLDYNAFKNGQTIFVYTLRPEDLKDTLALELSGNLRLSIQLKKGLEKNIVVLLFGDTKGVLTITGGRNIMVDSRA